MVADALCVISSSLGVLGDTHNHLTKLRLKELQNIDHNILGVMEMVVGVCVQDKILLREQRDLKSLFGDCHIYYQAK